MQNIDLLQLVNNWLIFSYPFPAHFIISQSQAKDSPNK